MPLFLLGAASTVAGWFGFNKVKDAVTGTSNPQGGTTAAPGIPWQVSLVLIMGATVGTVIVIKKLVD